jgi:hypothetical protein
MINMSTRCVDMKDFYELVYFPIQLNELEKAFYENYIKLFSNFLVICYNRIKNIYNLI